MATIGVTGASGFIGRQLIRQLEQRGHRALALSRPPAGSDDWRIPIGVDALVHLAGRAHVLREDAIDPSRAFEDSNVALTQQVVRAAAEAGVPRFVFMSSAGVLGNSSPPAGFDDHSAPQPHDAYSTSKWVAEQWLRSEACRSLDVVIIRPPMVYGPGARGNFPRILRLAASGWPLPIAALDAPRSLVGLRNLCDLIERAALDARATGATMLVADTETSSVRELATTLAQLVGRRPCLIYLPVSVVAILIRLIGRHADAMRLTQPFVLHATRVIELMDWRPPYSLLEELQWTMGAERQRQ